MTLRYNADADLWNNKWSNQFISASFSVSVDNRSSLLTPNTTQYGSFYPYRDACSGERDPSCLVSKALFYEARLPHLSNDSHTFEFHSVQSVLYNTTLPMVQNWTLSRRAISCEGGSQYLCRHQNHA